MIKKRKKEGPQVVVRAEGWRFHSPERAGKQHKHTGVEPKEKAGPKLQRRMRDSRKHIDKRACVKKTKMSKCET
jgi:hypothetical protein